MTVYVAYEGIGATNDFLAAYSDAGAALATWNPPNPSDHLARGQRGLQYDANTGILYAYRHQKYIAGGYYPDAPDKASSPLFNAMSVESFTSPASFGGHGTLTLTDNGVGGFGNSVTFTDDIGVVTGSSILAYHRRNSSVPDSGFAFHDISTGAETTFYSDTTGVVPRPAWWAYVGAAHGIVSVDTPGLQVENSALGSYGSRTTVYTVPSGSPVAFCVNPDTFDLFVAYYGGGSFTDLLIDRVALAGTPLVGTYVQTYQLTLVGGPFTPDPSNNGHTRALAARGGKLVANPYFENTAGTNDMGDGIWVVDIATGAGSDHPVVRVGVDTPPMFFNPITSLEIVPDMAAAGWHVGTLAMAG